MTRRKVTDGGYGFQLWKVAVNILNKQSRTTNKGCSPNFGVGREPETTDRKKTRSFLRNVLKSLGTERILWMKNQIGHETWYLQCEKPV
jgi:hypothetical protein